MSSKNNEANPSKVWVSQAILEYVFAALIATIPSILIWDITSINTTFKIFVWSMLTLVTYIYIDKKYYAENDE